MIRLPLYSILNKKLSSLRRTAGLPAVFLGRDFGVPLSIGRRKWAAGVCLGLTVGGCGGFQIMDDPASGTASQATVAVNEAESDLIKQLVNQLGVDSRQAAGGVGAIFASAQQRMSPEAFLQLSGLVPDIDNYLEAVPSSGTKFQLGADRNGMYGFRDNISGMSALASSFKELGMGTEMIERFLPVVFQYMYDHHGVEAMGLLQNALY